MSRRLQENIVAILFLGLFVGMLVIGFEYGPRARMVPIPIAVFGIALVVLQLLWQNLRSEDELQIDVFELLTGGNKQPEQAEAAEPQVKPAFGGELSGVGLVIGLLVMFLVLTPLPTAFLFTAGYFILSRHYTPLRGLLYATLFTVALWLLFGRLLHVPLDRSIFGSHYDILWFL